MGIEHGHDPASWLFPVIGASLALPWLVAIVWAWRRRIRDGAIPLSLGERARRRLLVR